MKDFHTLDNNALRAFYYAAQSLNFTQAARQAALTQSGISQHVRKLETDLGVDLFLRVGKSVQLTDSGRRLKSFTDLYLDQVSQLFEDLQIEAGEVSGVVKYAMPNSCLMSPHLTQLLAMREKDFPKIQLQVEICHSEQVVERLLNGDIDFGFVTRSFDFKELSLKEFVREEYVLASAHCAHTKIQKLEELQQTPLVEYPGMDVLFKRWLSDHFPKASRLPELRNLNVQAKIDSLEGAIKLVEGKVGMAIFPRHCIENSLASKKLHSCGKKLKNCSDSPIYIVERKGSQAPARVSKVLNAFWSMKKS